MKHRRLGAVIMMLATGSCSHLNTVSQSSRRKTMDTKPYIDACQARGVDPNCHELCEAAFDVNPDKKITACTYTIEGETTVINMTTEDKTDDDRRAESGQGCAGGRKPCGWEPSTGVRAPTAAGAYLALCAQLEAASVTAFMRIHRDLEARAAPATLLELVRDAMADELDHARVVAGLARRYGASPTLPEIAPEAPLSTLERAIDNVVAGCVGETVAALHAAFLGAHASDPVVRAAFAQIAEDETRHAYLAFELAAFYAPLLTDDESQIVADARARAIERAHAEALHPGLIALGLSGVDLHTATRSLLADPSVALS